jgi:myo-inositol-1(or 4)-monophosphatase
MRQYTEVAEQAARAGGRVLMEWFGRAKIREKGPKDLVTEADTASQRVVRDILLNAFPDHEFVGEEDDPSSDAASPQSRNPSALRWIVDPLDGTANYAHGLPGFAVSVGLVRGTEFLAGAVFDPWLDECYVATRGYGAWLNGNRLQVSGCEQLASAMVAVSLPANVERMAPDISRLENMLVVCQSLRRLGSAALNLCYLAAGRMDAYWSTTCKTWDLAAGVLVVSEAGGVVTNVSGGPFDLREPTFAIAATPRLHGEFLRVLAGSPASPAALSAPR